MLSIDDIRAAQINVYKHLKPTPLYHYTGLSELLGTDVWVKHENHQPVGAFKVRGGINLAASLTDEEKKRGLYTASSGNHGQSIAYASRAFGITATIAVPEGANPEKVALMKGMGAEVLFHGEDFDSAREWVEELAKEKNGKFVSPTDDELICGVGTYALEILEELPDVNKIFVPVGAGSGVCGTCIVAKNTDSDIRVIGVQSTEAPTMQRSWKSGELLSGEMNTTVEGIATRVAFESTQEIMRKYLDDFLLVSDESIYKALNLLIEHTHNLVEGAGAAAFAGALSVKETLKGQKIVVIMSGGNISTGQLSSILYG
ncbi:MAG: threonine dehydratase [Candidatus Marinimicrobia bacterium]|nr:threonine dehydratase [Candidatus Neomarinimicrobiota bacterium]TFB09738.1 threonine dehydratase [Candidatus Marinimicrobia bacterium MT.SAG.2]